jgi:predicted MPP superfamily phosphohydrolase
MKGVYFSNNSYGIRWWDKEQKKYIHGGRFATYDEACNALGQLTLKFDTPQISGVSASTDTREFEELVAIGQKAYNMVKQQAVAKKSQQIDLGKLPTGIAFLSDLHFGNAGTDYESILTDTNLINDTPGMYAAFHGDGIDNWIVGKLQAIQRGQAFSHADEISLFRSWLRKIHQKLLLVVSGNHDNWTKKISGLDLIPELLGETHVLYDPFESRVTVRCGTGAWDVLIRHQWKYSSIFNPTHGIEVGHDRMTNTFDIGVGGHTHIGTLMRPFFRHGKTKLAVLTGAYKRFDSFSKEIGYAETVSSGCGAIIFFPDGRLWYSPDLKAACDYLTYLRKEQS